MEFITLIGSVTLIHLLAVMSPGPDFLIIMKHALSYDRKVSIWTALGIGTGILIHVLYSFIGLGLIISNSPLLFNIIKYAGALYLLYLGVSSIRSSPLVLKDENEDIQESMPGPLKSFRIGFLTNVLNPKATLFFLSLFTLVIGTNTPTPILIVLSMIMVINTALWFMLLSYIITIKKIREKLNAYQKYFNVFFGILLILVALKIALG